jgi:CheY-like chemotaxis protein
VISNLIDNALKYTPPGGLITVAVREDREGARLEVADTGVGIAPALIGTIFDLFVQAERHLDKAQRGLGIGLTLVKTLVEMHGGTVHARRTGLGKGTMFTVLLPSIAAPGFPHEEEPSAETPLRHRRVLIVEDNDDARDMLRTALTLAGHDVHDATDGPSGLEALRRLKPDVALIDVGLPGLDGYEVAREARGIVGPTVKLVALTGYGRAEDRARALAAGFDAHLVKPADTQRLAKVIDAP